MKDFSSIMYHPTCSCFNWNRLERQEVISEINNTFHPRACLKVQKMLTRKRTPPQTTHSAHAHIEMKRTHKHMNITLSHSKKHFCTLFVSFSPHTDLMYSHIDICLQYFTPSVCHLSPSHTHTLIALLKL